VKPRRGLKAELSRWLMTLALTVIAAVPLVMLSVAGAVIWQARTDQARPADAIVVLGAAQYNGRPSPVLQARLDQALTLYRQGYAPLLVVTGGKQPGDVYTEADAGQMYLTARGVPASAILMESHSHDTWDNLKGVQTQLRGRGVKRLLIVSDGFHILRARLMARKLGFTSYGSPATGSPIRPWTLEEMGYVVRETGGILSFLPKML
jgi:uncharacterized SAM-binding protein YcdF (DUF218 family)